MLALGFAVLSLTLKYLSTDHQKLTDVNRLSWPAHCLPTKENESNVADSLRDRDERFATWLWRRDPAMASGKCVSVG